MYHNLGRTPDWNTCFVQARLTEENLRLHSSTQKETGRPCRIDEEQSWGSITELYYRYDSPMDFPEPDEAANAHEKDSSKLRKAASLEVLKAYGGCFASGFLALQDPLPNRQCPKLRSYESVGDFGTRLGSETPSCTTTSSNESLSSNSPRPDPATLVDRKSRRKWSWKGMRKSRKQAANIFRL